ncbi:hypothetical protein ACIQW7_25170 [Peribacillus simplex]|uniref:hypothetical protein n=1 Tax=Peribacillus simplex TaxID=1478 RepID=UPI00380C6862
MKEQSNNKNTASISENSIGRWKAIIESINDGVLMINHNGYERMINLQYSLLMLPKYVFTLGKIFQSTLFFCMVLLGGDLW